MTFEANKTILILDDNPARRVRLADALTRQGCLVQAAAVYRNASRIVRHAITDVVLINANVLGKPDSFVKTVKAANPNAKIYIVTGAPSELPTQYTEVHLLPSDMQEQELVALLSHR